MRGTGVLLLLLHLSLAQKSGLSCTDVNNQPCVFPFKYDGREFHVCTRHKSVNGKAWCASGVDRDGNAQCRKRGDCEDCSISNSSSDCFPYSQATCQEGGRSTGIFCLNENGDITCKEDDDCPEDYNDGQAKSVFSYTCYTDSDYGYGNDYARKNTCVENENEKQCNEDNLKTDPFCMRCRKCIKAGINKNGDPCSVCKKSQTTENCSCQASCDGFSSGGGNPWVSQSDPWCQGCLRCIAEGLDQFGDPCSSCKRSPLYENCDCKYSFPDCGSVKSKTDPWCEECRKCVQTGLDDNGDPFSLCKRRSATKSCHKSNQYALFPNCSSNEPAGPWCDQCRQCWEAELLKGREARCSNNLLSGPKTEKCPTNFPDFEASAQGAVPPKRITHTAGQSFRWVTF